MPNRPRSLRKLTFGSGRRKPSPEPPSPTFSDVTNVSAMNFGPNGPEKIITRANLKASLQAFEDLMNTSADYRAALMTMSKATAALADALERCSGLKGPTYEAGTRLQAASGLHHLIGNHWHVLAETIEKKFERPLRQHLDTYSIIVKERSATYERAVREKSQLIRDTERRSMNRKERNLQTFREALTLLQHQVDDLDNMKASHYREIIEHEEQVWEVVQGKTCIVVRSTMDVLDRFTAKASDPVLELMLQSVPDPFDSYGPPPAEDQIFSILTPLSIMQTQSSSTSPSAGHSDLDPTDIPPHNNVSSWLSNPSTRETYSSEAAHWNVNSSPSVSPTTPHRRDSTPSVSNQKSFSPDVPAVLSVIDEAGFNHVNNPSESPPRTITADEKSSPDTGQHHQSEWSAISGTSHSDSTEEDATTPQRLFFSADLPENRTHEPPDKADDTSRATPGDS